jgi:hypothetical protein
LILLQFEKPYRSQPLRCMDEKNPPEAQLIVEQGWGERATVGLSTGVPQRYVR